MALKTYSEFFFAIVTLLVKLRGEPSTHLLIKSLQSSMTLNVDSKYLAKDFAILCAPDTISKRDA